jgi:hypothetical protein
MKIKTLIIFSLCCQIMLYSHQVITSSGNCDKNSYGPLSWTLGEISTETLSNGQIMLTQGIQQPSITITSIFELMDVDYTINVFPNPTDAFIGLEISKEKVNEMHYILFDVNGKLLKNNKIDANKIEISFAELYPAIYFIKVYDKENEVKAFKIEKK